MNKEGFNLILATLPVETISNRLVLVLRTSPSEDRCNLIYRYPGGMYFCIYDSYDGFWRRCEIVIHTPHEIIELIRKSRKSRTSFWQVLYSTAVFPSRRSKEFYIAYKLSCNYVFRGGKTGTITKLEALALEDLRKDLGLTSKD